MNRKHKDFISLSQYEPAEITALLDLACQLKDEQKRGRQHRLLEGQSLAMIFAKSSTRTRVSFEVGMFQLGGQALYLNNNDIQLGRGEGIRDTARVLSRYVDGIMIRTYSHRSVMELADYSSVPVINGLTDLEHPCQVLCDLMTIREQKGALKGLKLAYIGDGNNMANSLLHGSTLQGMDISIATPAGYEPDPQALREARAIASKTGSAIELTHDPQKAVTGADVVYTDTWISMGQEAEKAEKTAVFKGFTVDSDLLTKADPAAMFLHCLPAYLNYEVTEDVFEGPQSFVFDQAENRLHAQKAILVSLLKKD